MLNQWLRPNKLRTKLSQMKKMTRFHRRKKLKRMMNLTTALHQMRKRAQIPTRTVPKLKSK